VVEEVLVVPAELVGRHLGGEGLLPVDRATLRLLMQGSHFTPRHSAEGNPLYRQLIPYVVVLNKGGEVFAVTRLKAQSEERLHHKLSIGMGGHINPNDGALGLELLWAAAWRELGEEVDIVDAGPLGELEFCGLINDLSTPVSRDHLGCLFLLRTSGAVLVREGGKMQGGFMPWEELKRRSEELESWSSQVLPCLTRLTSKWR